MLDIIFGSTQKHCDQSAIQNNIENSTNKLPLKFAPLFSGHVAAYSRYKNFSCETNEHFVLTRIGTVYLKDESSEIVSDSDLLLQYEQQGLSLLKKLTGHFLLSIYDKRKSTCLIVNDILGSLPFFYSLTKEKEFVFSNKLSCIKNISIANTVLNKQAIYDYMYFHMIPSPQTIYKDIYKLQPGHYVLFKDNKIVTKPYFFPSFSETSLTSPAEFANDILETLDRSVASTVKQYSDTGSFLSGGLDSSAVSGMLSRHASKQAKTFSIGFPIEKYNEIDFARLAAKTFNTEQFEYFIQPEDVTASIHDIVGVMDEPFGNSSVVPVYYCAKLAKKNGVTTLLAGDGGDELFAGNTRYSKQRIFEYYFIIPEFVRKKIIEPLVNNKLSNSNFFGRKLNSYIRQANVRLPERLESYNFLHLNKPEDVFTPDFIKKIDVKAPLLLIDKVYNSPENASILNKMLFLDWKHTLADNDLNKVNMMCELAGVNVVYPMLSNEMLSLSCKIPSKLKLTPKKLRYIYKLAMKGFLPERIINKSKHGFGLPFGIWTSTEKPLQDIAYASIESLKKHNIFSEDFLTETIRKHKEEHAAFYGELIWVLMILSIWIEKNEA